jgi:hypothetical protein
MRSVTNNFIKCKGCGRKIPFNIRFKPAIKELFDKKNRKQTWVWIFIIAVITQVIAQFLSDLFFRYII